MQQENTDNSYFEAHWDRTGKVRTLFPVASGRFQNRADSQIFGLADDQMGGLAGIIHAKSTNAALQIAQDHMLCMLMDMTGCKHIKPTGSSSSDQDDAR